MFFRQAMGYQRTELLEDIETHGRFVSIDYRDNKGAWDRMKLNSRRVFEQIDEACKNLTRNERLIGNFEVC